MKVLIDINCPECHSDKTNRVLSESTLTKYNNRSYALFICENCDKTFIVRYVNDATNDFKVIFEKSKCTRDSINISEMEDIENIKESIRKNIIFETISPYDKGGQTVSIVRLNTILISKELDIKIEIGAHRSAIKNRDLAMVLFELAMDEIIK